MIVDDYSDKPALLEVEDEERATTPVLRVSEGDDKEESMMRCSGSRVDSAGRSWAIVEYDADGVVNPVIIPAALDGDALRWCHEVLHSQVVSDNDSNVLEHV